MPDKKDRTFMSMEEYEQIDKWFERQEKKAEERHIKPEMQDTLAAFISIWIVLTILMFLCNLLADVRLFLSMLSYTAVTIFLMDQIKEYYKRFGDE